jgi:hypothetical protein
MCKSGMPPLFIAVWKESQGLLPPHARSGSSRDSSGLVFGIVHAYISV